jgi:hypothetical protein
VFGCMYSEFHIWLISLGPSLQNQFLSHSKLLQCTEHDFQLLVSTRWLQLLELGFT